MIFLSSVRELHKHDGILIKMDIPRDPREGLLLGNYETTNQRSLGEIDSSC